MKEALRRLRADVPARLWWGAIAATLVAQVWAWRIKARCVDAAFGTPEPFARRCYNDVQSLWGQRGFHDQLPYKESFNEYPPVTAFVQAGLGRMSDDAEQFVHLNAAMGLVLALTVTILLLRAGVQQRAYLWALAPAVILYAAYNWDLLAVAPTVAAVLAFQKDRPGLAGALLAVGASAKWYPAALLPILGMVLVRREGRIGPQGWRFGAWAVGVLAVIHGGTYLWAGDGYLEAYRFHIGRTATLESHWYIAQLYLDRWGWVDGSTVVAVASKATYAYLVVLAGLAALAWKDRIEWKKAGAAALVLWLVLMPVLSIQYAIWVLPLLILAAVPVRLIAAFLVADLATYLGVMRYFTVQPRDFWNAVETLALASWFRLAVLLALATWLGIDAWRHGRGHHDGTPTGSRDGGDAPRESDGLSPHEVPRAHLVEAGAGARRP